jgi:hypothetical protein
VPSVYTWYSRVKPENAFEERPEIDAQLNPQLPKSIPNFHPQLDSHSAYPTSSDRCTKFANSFFAKLAKVLQILHKIVGKISRLNAYTRATSAVLTKLQTGSLVKSCPLIHLFGCVREGRRPQSTCGTRDGARAQPRAVQQRRESGERACHLKAHLLCRLETAAPCSGGPPAWCKPRQWRWV